MYIFLVTVNGLIEKYCIELDQTFNHVLCKSIIKKIYINKYIYYIYNLIIIIIIFFKLECMFTKETTVNSVSENHT